MSTNLTYGRHYARAEGEQRAYQVTPLHGGPNVTLVAALTPDGLGALMSVDGAVNGDVFAAYLNQVLDPTLRPGDVVVLDNLSVHKMDGLHEIVQKYGARLRYLPPYSPGTLIRLNWLSASLKRGCAPRKHAPATRSKKPCWSLPHG